MAKFTVDEKIQIAKAYLEGQDSQKGLARQFNVSQRTLQQWIGLYRLHGEEGLRKRYTSYSAEFKMEVLKYMNDTGASPLEAAAVFGIPSRTTVINWREMLKAGGKDALIPRKKGRPSVKEKPKKPSSTDNPTESLQEEVERLRMEVAYLKKLNALVQEKEQSRRNSKRK